MAYCQTLISRTASVVNLTGYVPPHSPDSEHELLGFMLSNPDQIAAIATKFDACYFFTERNRTTYVAMVEMDTQGLAVDIVSLRDFLRTTGNKIHEADLASLLNTYSIAPNRHMAIIARDYYHRATVGKLSEALERAKEPMCVFDDLRAVLIDAMEDLSMVYEGLNKYDYQ